MKNKNFWKVALVAAIVALAFFLRIVNINETPPGIYPDEAAYGEDALKAAQTGNYQWFYPNNQGREGLFINLLAFLFKFFGVSVLTLKLPAIIFGTLTVLGAYLLAKELFQKYYLAVISSFLVAVSFWPLNFSRISFRASMLPLALVFSFYFLFRGLRTRKISDFIISGFIFGLGLHTYIAFRVAPLILIAVFVSCLLSYESFLKKYWKSVLVFSASALIAVLPMLYTFFYAHPEYLESRSSSISIFSPQVNQGHLVQTFLKSFGLSLVKYNFWGDQNWRHNFPPYPILDAITGIAFLFGLIYSIIKLVYYIFRRIFKKVRDLRLNIYTLLVSWFFVMLVPEFLTAEGLPHALRSIGTLPAVFIFSAITFNYLFEKSERHGFFFKIATQGVLIFIIILIGLFNILKYHLVWANRIETARAFEKVLMDVSGEIKNTRDKQAVFVITGTMQRIPIKLFNSEVPADHFKHPHETEQILNSGIKNPVIFMTDKNDDAIGKLKDGCPALELKEIKDRFGISRYVLK